MLRLGMFRERLGEQWCDAWLTQGVPGVHRAMLPVALADDPEAALHELREPDPTAFAQFEAQARQAMRRFLQTNDRNALDAAVTAWNAILEHPDFDTAQHDFRLAVFNDAGGAFLRRYWSRGLAQDLDHALTLLEKAVQTTPPDSPNLPVYLNYLGDGLESRYARTGQLEDLEQAIRAAQQAVQITPPDSPDLPMYRNNLGDMLRSRYAQTGRLEDLEQAIRVAQQAVQTSLPDSPNLPMYLNNLGAGLGDRYTRTGQPEDLEWAIRVYQQAVQITPPGSPTQPIYLDNLGDGLGTRYARTRRPEDLEEALRAAQQAVQITPPDSPTLPSCLSHLGNRLRDRYAQTGQPEDLKQAQTSYATACARGQLLAPEVALIAAHTWGYWASERKAWEEAVEAFETGIAIGEQLHRTQLRRSDQETWLGGARGLHMHAAYALVQTATPTVYRRAVEILPRSGVPVALARPWPATAATSRRLSAPIQRCTHAIGKPLIECVSLSVLKARISAGVPKSLW